VVQSIGFLTWYWEYCEWLPVFRLAFRRPFSHYDPTEIGQFSNIVGRGIADYLGRNLSGAIQAHAYEDALKVRKIPYSGPRPDLYCDTGTQQFSMEAKGLSAGTVSANAMTGHKAQAKAGPLPVHFAIASVSYNLYRTPSCKYFDPVADRADYDGSLAVILARLKYISLLSIVDRLPRLRDASIGNEIVERFRLSTAEDAPLALLLAKRVRSIVEHPDVAPARIERIEREDEFLDVDGIGLQIA
jgi:hypothetical protein